VSDGDTSHTTPVRTDTGLEIRVVIVRDDVDGALRDRQLAAIVRLLRSAAEHHTPATVTREQ
jgi:hypothetical protein